MRLRIALALVALTTVVVPTGPAGSAGGMGIPSTGTIGGTGWFLSCRTTTSSTSSTPYYDRQNVLRTWDCGAGHRPHKGVDILGSTTPGVTPVYAAAAGTVWTAERGNGFGWRVVLRHGAVGGNGRFTYTIYGHMGNCGAGSSLIASGIAPGVQVAAGRLLGWQGNDGYPNGCLSRVHLHWEVRASNSDVTNVFLATPASPNFYTGVQLTADDPAKATSVQASTPAPSPTPTPSPTPRPTPSPTPTPSPSPSASPASVTPSPSSSPSPRFTIRPRPTRRPRPTTTFQRP